MPYYQYNIQVAETQKREIAIALLNGLGFEGFEENESELIAFSKNIKSENELHEIMQVIDATYYTSIVEEVNWNEKWESEFQPITVLFPGSKEVFAYVRAHFHTALTETLYDLIITPKMSFGTGHHATTYGMMAYMSGIDFKGLSVVDFGTGTGVLAILAEKMGAKKVFAIDNDPWCIRNAQENIVVNKCSHIELKEIDHFQILDKPDIILANINLNIIKNNLGFINAASKSATTILISGIMEKDEDEILFALHSFDIKEIDIIKNDGWLIIAANPGK